MSTVNLEWNENNISEQELRRAIKMMKEKKVTYECDMMAEY